MKRFTLLLLVGVGACATATLPPTHLEASSAAIRAAEDAGSKDVPQAALHLQLAKEQSDKAKKLAEKGYVEHATRLLARAEADADLALALTRCEQAKTEANEASDQIKQFEQDTEQTPTTP